MSSFLNLLERPGLTMVTSTRRLARTLLEIHGDRQAARGVRAWRTPQVLCWDDWTVESWSQLTLSPRRACARTVLNDSQELLLFERAIEHSIGDQVDASLVPVFTTARAARDAWNLAHEWQLPYDELAQYDDADCAMFKRWVDWVDQRLRDRSWITRAQLPMALTEAVTADIWRPAGSLAVVGFDELPPVRRALLEQLRRAGVEVSCPQGDVRRGCAHTVGLADRQSELKAAAGWARQLLASGAETPIGIVVPDLGATRATVDRVMRQTLHPEAALSTPTPAPHYHISLGNRLRDYPIVHCALSLLRWCQGPIAFDELSRVLHSPFVAGGERHLADRAALALQLGGYERLGLDDLSRHLERYGDEGGLRTMVTALRAMAPTSGDRATAADWAERFAAVLSAFGWPGECGLDSAEQQTREAWRDILSRLASLGAIVPTMDAAEALRRIMQMVTVRVFQPRAPAAPIQVLGIAEAAGLQFAHLWILGMSDEFWPPSPRPNPFLPLALQRRYGIPAATAARQLAYSEITSRRLRTSADEVVVSYGRRSGEQVLHLSPLFSQLPAWSGPVAEGEDFAATVQSSAAALDEIVDDRGPAVAVGEQVRGGAGLLRDQAACPFRAFAHYRLGAQAVPVLEPGLDAAERGTLVHACLAGVWRVLGGSDGLRARSDADLRALVDERVTEAVRARLGQQPGSFAQAVGDIERARLVALVMEWLEFERLRPPFTVLETESSATLELAGLSLRLKIDRLDEYGAGRRFLIDYKTARAGRVDMWFGARPEEPQLPAYFLVRQAPSALAFARVRCGDCAFIGAADGESPAAGIAPADEVIAAEPSLGWNALAAHWERILGRLAAEFASGQAAVDPRDEKVCKHCDITPLCRVFETWVDE